MSDLDKFVLTYSVESREAIARLDKLNEKIAGVSKESSKAKSSIGEFASGAVDEIGKVTPGLNAISTAMRGIVGATGAAGIAVGALAIGIKSVLDLREKFNAQRSLGFEVGVAPQRIEEYRRQLVRAGGGHISNEQADSVSKTIHDTIRAAYIDPTRMSPENRKLRLLGINPGRPGEGPLDTNAAMSQVATAFSKISPEAAIAAGQVLGLLPDASLALRKVGDSIGHVKEQSAAELAARAKAEEAVSQLNIAMAGIEQSFGNTYQIIGRELTPAVTTLVQELAKLVAQLPDAVQGIANFIHGVTTPAQDRERAIREDAQERYKKALKANGGNPVMAALTDPKGTLFGTNDPMSAGVNSKLYEQAKRDAEAAYDKAHPKEKEDDKLQKMLDEAAHAADASNAQVARNNAEFARQVALFAGATATFAGVTSEQEIYAAWAGELGRAAGLGSGSKEPGAALNKSAPDRGATPYDALFEKVAAKLGIDKNDLKGIATVESSLNPNAVSPKGAQGLMQVMPKNQKSLGIKDPFDPEQSITGGARLYKQYLKAANGDKATALMMYHAGPDRSGWGPLTQAYPAKVLGYQHDSGIGRVQGESRDKINYRNSQATIAQQLGVPVGQIQTGGVSKGDAAFAAQQAIGGIKNKLAQDNLSLNNQLLTQSERARILTEIRTQTLGLRNMEKYSTGIVAMQQDGSRDRTIGVRDVIINTTVNATGGSPEEIGKHIAAHSATELSKVINSNTDGLKY